MKTCVFLVLISALTAMRGHAQSILTPYSWQTIAGEDNSPYAFADGTNSDAAFNLPLGVAVDWEGNLYVADTLNNVIRVVTPVGTNWVVTTLAGTPQYDANGVPIGGYADGTNALFSGPMGIAVDLLQNVYVADYTNCAIRMITPAGVVSTIAGKPQFNSQGAYICGSADGQGNIARFCAPMGLTIDNAGNLYVADSGNNAIRKLRPTGATWEVSTLAGSANNNPGHADGQGPKATFYGPSSVAVDGTGNVYVADQNNSLIRKVTPAGAVTTLAGHFVQPQAYIPYGNADGIGAQAQFNFPQGLAVDNAGNVYVADTYNSEIRRVTPDGMVTTLGGLSVFNFFGYPDGSWADGTGTNALFNWPVGIAVDTAGNLYVTEGKNCDIRKGVFAPAITPLRVTQPQAAVGVTDGVDDPIVPVVDQTALAAALPLGQGVVADGVTPVLFQIIASPGVYTCRLSLNNGATFLGLIMDSFFVLQNGQWVNSSALTIPAGGSIGRNFAYLSGLDWTSFITGLSNEVQAVLTVTSAQTGARGSTTFRIRPPPVALVHGYNADGTSWTPAFTNVLSLDRPADFIIAVNYGTSNGKNTVNTTWTLDALVPVVDSALREQVEAPISDHWAFTRYDVVCHSQGGVLVRMLCQNVWSDTPIVAAENAFRGRFRRVITLGSPHNGSLLLRYILDMEHSGNETAWAINRVLILKNIAQPKFDPFGPQIAMANNPLFPVDENIKFHCLRTTIADGQPPTAVYDPLDYSVLGLCQPQPGSALTAGQLLLPGGADGVVDLASQGAGAGTLGTIMTNTPQLSTNIAHADTPPLFGVPPGQSQTSDPRVASVVAGLLAGPGEAFGPFQLPTVLTDSTLVDSLVPQTLSVASLASLLPIPLDNTSNYSYAAQLPQGTALGGTFSWIAEVFGTNGISTDGLTLTFQQTTAGIPEATVSVASSVLGTVVLYPFYDTTNGTLLIGAPIVVLDRPLGPAPASIAVDPTQASLPVGTSLALNLWGRYAGGASNMLYTPIGQVTYTSSNTNAVTVDASGDVLQVGYGSSTITAVYSGLSAQTIISAAPVSIRKFSGAAVSGGFKLSYVASCGTTNVIETSTNLVDWAPLTQFLNTTGLVTYMDPRGTNISRRFYRVRIP